MDQYNVYDVAEKIFAAIQKEREGMTHMNVMVMGKTGSGKSTLINNMFNEKLADTGIGKPVTQAIRQYSKEGFPLTIYDTPGLELGGDNAISELLKDATDCIKKGVKSGKMDDAIHCILYCVNAGTHRFEDAEKEFIAQFLSENKAFNIPVIVVITQAVNKKDAAELKRIIEAENMDIIQVVPVLCQAVEITDEITIPAYGLDTLAEIIYRVIPEALQKTFVAVQKADIKLKTVEQECRTIIVNFLKNLSTQIKSGAPVAIAVPAWLRPDGTYYHLKILDELEKLGYNVKKYNNLSQKDLLYHRDDQIVAREIIVLRKK